MGVENLELAPPDSSVDLDAVVTGADAPAQPEPVAKPSDATEGEKFDLLSVVRNASQPKADDAASPAGQQDESDQPSAAAAPSEPTEPDNETFLDVAFHKHPRFRELVAQRNHYRDGARQYEQVQDFLQTHGLSANDAADALVLHALRKSDPAKAWEMLKPIAQELALKAGAVVLPEYAERVKRGEITRQTAMEMSRMKATQDSGAQAQEFARQQAEQRAQQEAVRSIQTAVGEWERATKMRDPDFDKKEEALQKEILWLRQKDGPVKSPEEARRRVQMAYETVTKLMAPARKGGVTPLPQGKVATGASTAKPDSILDIVRRVQSSG